jgi:hypothetical protein
MCYLKLEEAIESIIAQGYQICKEIQKVSVKNDPGLGWYFQEDLKYTCKTINFHSEIGKSI